MKHPISLNIFLFLVLAFTLPFTVFGCTDAGVTYSPAERFVYDEYTIQVTASEYVARCVGQASTRRNEDDDDMGYIIQECQNTADAIFARRVRGVNIIDNYDSSFVPCSEVRHLPLDARKYCP